MNQNQNTGAYTAADPNESFFFLIGALKKNPYSRQVVTALMDEFLKRGMYHEFLQLTAIRIESERKQNEEERRQEIEAGNKDASDTFLYTMILTLVCLSLSPWLLKGGTFGIVLSLIFCVVALVGACSLTIMVFKALLRAGRY